MEEAEVSPLEVLMARCPALEEDILMALRFLYYVKSRPVLPDGMYDEAEREFLARPEVEDSKLMNPGSDRKEDYSEPQQALAFYLLLSMEGERAGIVKKSKGRKKQGELF